MVIGAHGKTFYWDIGACNSEAVYIPRILFSDVAWPFFSYDFAEKYMVHDCMLTYEFYKNFNAALWPKFLKRYLEEKMHFNAQNNYFRKKILQHLRFGCIHRNCFRSCEILHIFKILLSKISVFVEAAYAVSSSKPQGEINTGEFRNY